MKQKKQIAYLRSNIWGNYYVIVSGKKVRDWKGRLSNKPEIFDWIGENYPNAQIVDQTKY